MTDQQQLQLREILLTASTDKERLQILEDIKLLTSSKFDLMASKIQNKKKHLLEIRQNELKQLKSITPLQTKHIKLNFKPKNTLLSLIQNRNLSVEDRVFKKPKIQFFNPGEVKRRWGQNTNSLPDLDDKDKQAAKKFYLKDKPYLKINRVKKPTTQRRPGLENLPSGNMSARSVTSVKSVKSNFRGKQNASNPPKWKY